MNPEGASAGSVEERLATLALRLPPPPTPLAAFVPVSEDGRSLYVSGQIATAADGALPYRGRVGAEVSREQAVECAYLCALNLLAQLQARLGSLDRVERLVKVQVYVLSAAWFAEQHLVANGASELLFAVFGDRGAHAHSAIGVAGLPFDSPVEIDAVARTLAAARP